MRKTIYIEADEEITSVIDRIRGEEAGEIFLVIPKGALITQGVINLRLMKKETDKVGKSVTIITGDPLVRKVVERLGIQIGERSDQFLPDNGSAEFSKEGIIEKVSNETASDFSSQDEENLNKVGSMSFFDKEEGREELLSDESEVEKNKGLTEKDIKKIPPEDLRAELYAKKQITNRVEKREEQKPIPASANSDQRKGLFIKNRDPLPLYQPRRIDNAKTSSIANGSQKGLLAKRKPSEINQERENPSPFSLSVSAGKIFNREKSGFGPSGFFDKEDFKKAEDFFGGRGEKKKNLFATNEEETNSGRRGGFAKKFVLIILIFGLISGGIFLIHGKYPRVMVNIYPRSKEIAKDLKIAVSEEKKEVGFEGDEFIVPGRFIEEVIEKKLIFKATGEGFVSDDGKARGKVKIYNRYSTTGQALVATTRILSKEGKLFRLSGAVTVPGMSGEEPGVVEANVVADKPGEEYDIEPTSFTIEGFKGGPKYEKFEVFSDEKISGGQEPDPSKKMTVVTEADINSAREKTLQAMDDSLEEELKKKLQEGETLVIDSVEKQIEGGVSSHQKDEVTNDFTYTVKERVKVLVFSKEDLNKIVFEELEKELDDNYKISGESEISYKKSILDLEKKRLSLYIDAKVITWPEVEKENLVKSLVENADEESLKKMMTNYPEIEKIEMNFSPSWLSWLPLSEEKVEIEEKK